MRSSFYKLLVTDDFKSRLRLPPQFVKEHAEALPRKATLRIGSGESWIVRVESIGQHRYFTDGWEKFCGDVDLEFKQFLLFWFDGDSGFSVSAYAMSGCEKELFARSDTSGGSEEHAGDGVSRHGEFAVKQEVEDEDVKIDEEHGGKQWRFCAKLKKHHETELEVPVGFAKATGIAENGRILLLMHKSRWPVFVSARRQGESYAMTVGWNDFLVGRKVCIGSTILFQFLSNRDNILIEAKVVKQGSKGFFSRKKRRGRPPKF